MQASNSPGRRPSMDGPHESKVPRAGDQQPAPQGAAGHVAIQGFQISSGPGMAPPDNPVSIHINNSTADPPNDDDLRAQTRRSCCTRLLNRVASACASFPGAAVYLTCRDFAFQAAGLTVSNSIRSAVALGALAFTQMPRHSTDPDDAWIGAGTGLVIGAGALFVFPTASYMGVAAGTTLANALNLPEESRRRQLIQALSVGLVAVVPLATLAVLAATSEDPFDSVGFAISYLGTTGGRLVGQPLRDYLNRATSGLAPAMTIRDRNDAAIGDSPDYARYQAIRMAILVPTYLGLSVFHQTSGKQLLTDALGFGDEDLQSFQSLLQASVGPILSSASLEGVDAVMGLISHYVAAYLIGATIEWSPASGELCERINPLGDYGRNWADVRANGAMRVSFFGPVDTLLALADRPGMSTAAQFQLRAAAGIFHGLSELRGLIAQRGLRPIMRGLDDAIKALKASELINKLERDLENFTELMQDADNEEDVRQMLASNRALIHQVRTAEQPPGADSQNFQEFGAPARNDPVPLPNLSSAEREDLRRIMKGLEDAIKVVKNSQLRTKLERALADWAEFMREVDNSESLERMLAINGALLDQVRPEERSRGADSQNFKEFAARGRSEPPNRIPDHHVAIHAAAVGGSHGAGGSARDYQALVALVQARLDQDRTSSSSLPQRQFDIPLAFTESGDVEINIGRGGRAHVDIKAGAGVAHVTLYASWSGMSPGAGTPSSDEVPKVLRNSVWSDMTEVAMHIGTTSNEARSPGPAPLRNAPTRHTNANNTEDANHVAVHAAGAAVPGGIVAPAADHQASGSSSGAGTEASSIPRNLAPDSLRKHRPQKRPPPTPTNRTSRTERS